MTAAHLTALSVLALFFVLVTGCDQAKSASSNSKTNPPPAADTAAPTNDRPVLHPNAYPASPHFNRVVQRLDVGGKMMQFRDFEGRREVFIEIANSILELIPEEQRPENLDPAELIDALGIANAAASGRSLRQDNEAWLSRSYSYHPEGPGALAKLLGKEAIPFRSPSLLPAATDLVLETRIDTSALPGLLMRIGKAVNQEKSIGDFLGEQLPIGLTAKALLSKTNLHVIFGLDVSNLAEAGEAGGAPDFILQIDGAKALLDSMLAEFEEGLGPAQTYGNRKGWKLPLPPQLRQGESQAIILVDDSGRLTFASRAAYLQFVESDSMKLASEKDFLSSTDFYPKAGNFLFYGSRQLMPVVGNLMKGATADLDEDSGNLLKALADSLEAKPLSACISFEPDGISTICELPFAMDVNPASAGVVLATTSTLFVGARAWKRGSDRAGCIMNQRNVQQAVRSYQNMNGLKIGDPLPHEEVFGPGKWIEHVPVCPDGGTYTFTKVIPKIGELGCRCSHAESDQHVPTHYKDW